MSPAAMSAAGSKPAHVVDALVYDFDMFADPAYVADPNKRILDRVKNAPPVCWTPRNGGHWMIMSHEANFTASRDIETFSSNFISKERLAAMQAQAPRHLPMPLPINDDPPDHTKYRAQIGRAHV